MTTHADQLNAALGGKYRIERELGRGGMATVYLAHDIKHERDVAIKVLHPDLGAALGGERFVTEIRTTARLQHAHILPLLDSGDGGNGVLYYVMPLMTGETLRARLERERQLPIADAVRIAREVASALDYAHRQNVIHRDIKPENILLHDGQAIVADFGIALAVQQAGGQRLTQTGLSLGTPQYMSPEQAMGERAIDARSDIYSLAAVTYEMLTGDPPFTGSNVQAVVAKVMNANVERPSLTRKAVTPSIEAAVLRALEKLPADRFGTAAEFASALGQDSTGATTVSRAKSTVRASVAAIAVLAAVALVWFTNRGASNAATLERSVIVLPFENTSRDTTQEYFADGLTDELIGRLAAAGLRVTGRNTGLAYKGKHPTAREVGKVADVATVLSGQVRRLGEQFRVTAELANAASDSVMWSYTKDSRTADAFALQRELVDSIIARFQIAPRTIAAGEATDASVSAQAHDYALRGRFSFGQFTPDGLKAALALYDSALALAPRYVDAHLGKATVLTAFGDGYESPRTVLPRVQAILAVVAGIDSSRADYWGTRSLLGANWIWNWPTVRSDAARARAIEPLNANALLAGAFARLATGNFWGVMATLDTMQRSDPLSPLPLWVRFFLYSVAGVRDSTQAVWQRLPDYFRNGSYGDVSEGIAMLAFGRNADAERAFRQGEAALGHPSPLRVVALARLGRTAEALTQLKVVEQAFGKPYFAPEFIAACAAELGDTTTMYRWLDTGQRERSGFALNLGIWDRPFRAHRQEPHFQRILQQMGVTPVTFAAPAKR